MLKLLHYDLILHFALLVVTFLVKVTFCAINFVSCLRWRLDWIVSKCFYMKSTDVSICPVTFIKIHLNGRRNENSFKEGAIFLDTHFNILCKKLYKQATLSDNRGETEI